jgi:hypothetical protein
VPEVVKRSKTKTNVDRLVNLEPWDPKALAKAYGNHNVDCDYADKVTMTGQSFPKEY